MAIILDNVATETLARRPHLRAMLQAFLPDFDVTFGDERRVLGTSLTIFYLKPAEHMKEAFGLDREVMLVHASQTTIQPKLLQAASEILSKPPAAGRVDPLVYIIVSSAHHVEDTIKSLMVDSAHVRVPIPFQEQHCIQAAQTPLFVRNAFARHLFAKDLFDIRQPVSGELYFFGRTSLVADLRDAVRNGENIGLFGLRKTGKTSILLKLQEELEEEKSAHLVYVDLQNPTAYRVRWWELLSQLHSKIPQATPSSGYTEDNAPRLFEAALERYSRLFPGQRLVFALDEIEHISPRLRMEEHWDYDFLEFWKALRAIQNVQRNVAFIVAGVNASAIETPSFGRQDNPLFSMAKIRYMPGFTRDEARQMIRTLGRKMGLKFDEEIYGYILQQYGGHPLLMRMACSHTHRSIPTNRPYQVTVSRLDAESRARDQELFAYGDHILGMLRDWYPTEYQMLRDLAADDRAAFAVAAQSYPQSERHLVMYQLVSQDTSELRMPFLKRYLRAHSPAHPLAANVGGSDDDPLAEISALRNAMEPKLRRYVKRVLILTHGPDRWIDPILAAIPGEQRKALQGVDKDDILKKHLFLGTLIQVIEGNWSSFEHLERAPGGKKITRHQLKVLLDFVNNHREDAHAKELDVGTLSGVRIACRSIDKVLAMYLED